MILNHAGLIEYRFQGIADGLSYGMAVGGDELTGKIVDELMVLGPDQMPDP
jgi:hypothetical protein